MTTIKVNNKTITIANKSTESFDIDKESLALESLAIDISKSTEALNIVSNIKAIESFGYKSTEGVGEKIKAGAKAVWDKIKQFFEKICKFFKNIFKSVKDRLNNFILHKEILDYIKNIIKDDDYIYNKIVNSDKTIKIESMYWSCIQNFSKGDYSFLENKLNNIKSSYNLLKSIDDVYKHLSKTIKNMHDNINNGNIDNITTRDYLKTVKDLMHEMDDKTYNYKFIENTTKNESSSLNVISVKLFDFWDTMTKWTTSNDNKFIKLTCDIKQVIDDIDNFTTGHTIREMQKDFKYMDEIYSALLSHKIKDDSAEYEVEIIRETSADLSSIITKLNQIIIQGAKISLNCNKIYENIRIYYDLVKDFYM